ncbi:hypothetical protein DFH29DRAFT_933702, partial [Suillus ampliporus]
SLVIWLGGHCHWCSANPEQSLLSMYLLNFEEDPTDIRPYVRKGSSTCCYIHHHHLPSTGSTLSSCPCCICQLSGAQ